MGCIGFIFYLFQNLQGKGWILRLIIQTHPNISNIMWGQGNNQGGGWGNQGGNQGGWGNQGQGQGGWGNQGQGQGGWGNQGQGQGGNQGFDQGNQGFQTAAGGWTIIPEKTFPAKNAGEIDISSVVPAFAKEVKFFMDIESGHHGQDRSSLITISSDQDKAKFRIHVYPQNAWAYNSDNFSLFMGQKKLRVTYEGHSDPINGNGTINLVVLGYR